MFSLNYIYNGDQNPPTGTLPAKWIGACGDGSCCFIGPRHAITAKHVTIAVGDKINDPTNPTFTYDHTPSGSVTVRTIAEIIDHPAIGENVMDYRILRIADDEPDFPGWFQLPKRLPDVGERMLLGGTGDSAAQADPPATTIGEFRSIRWAANAVASFLTTDGNINFSFDQSSSGDYVTNEGIACTHDSGGALTDGAVLYGIITYGVAFGSIPSYGSSCGGPSLYQVVLTDGSTYSVYDWVMGIIGNVVDTTIANAFDREQKLKSAGGLPMFFIDCYQNGITAVPENDPLLAEPHVAPLLHVDCRYDEDGFHGGGAGANPESAALLLADNLTLLKSRNSTWTSGRYGVWINGFNTGETTLYINDHPSDLVEVDGVAYASPFTANSRASSADWMPRFAAAHKNNCDILGLKYTNNIWDDVEAETTGAGTMLASWGLNKSVAARTAWLADPRAGTAGQSDGELFDGAQNLATWYANNQNDTDGNPIVDGTDAQRQREATALGIGYAYARSKIIYEPWEAVFGPVAAGSWNGSFTGTRSHPTQQSPNHDGFAAIENYFRQMLPSGENCVFFPHYANSGVTAKLIGWGVPASNQGVLNWQKDPRIGYVPESSNPSPNVYVQCIQIASKIYQAVAADSVTAYSQLLPIVSPSLTNGVQEGTSYDFSMSQTVMPALAQSMVDLFKSGFKAAYWYEPGYSDKTTPTFVDNSANRANCLAFVRLVRTMLSTGVSFASSIGSRKLIPESVINFGSPFPLAIKGGLASDQQGAMDLGLLAYEGSGSVLDLDGGLHPIGIGIQIGL